MDAKVDHYHIDKARVRASFGRAASSYDAAAILQKQVREEMLSRLDWVTLNPGTILDAGCGTGALAAALAPHVAHVHAIDASPAMLSAASSRLAACSNVTLSEGTLEALPLGDASLDAAVLMLVLHHVADPLRALRDVRRVLRPNGRLLISDMRPHAQERYREQMGHVWLGFAPLELTAWLHDAGFTNVRYVPLPVDPDATGPALFSATARCAVDFRSDSSLRIHS